MKTWGPFYAWARGPNGRDPWGLGVRLYVWPGAPVGSVMTLAFLVGPFAAEMGIVLRARRCERCGVRLWRRGVLCDACAKATGRDRDGFLTAAAILAAERA